MLNTDYNFSINASILEIQKMYFLPKIRGLGLAKQLLEHAFDFAAQHGFKVCYLETTQQLKQALKLYEKLGFIYLHHPLGICTMPYVTYFLMLSRA